MDAKAELHAEQGRLVAAKGRLPERPSDAEIHDLHVLAGKVANEGEKAADLAQHEGSVARSTTEHFESDGARRLVSNMVEVSASFAEASLMLSNAAAAIKARASVLQARQDAYDTDLMRIETRLYDIDRELRR